MLDGTFEALADPTRRGVIDLLRVEPRRASEIADALGMSRPAMSRHLRVLSERGLIETVADGADARAKIFRLRPEPFTEIRDWLEHIEEFWTTQLAAFKTHAENKRDRR